MKFFFVLFCFLFSKIKKNFGFEFNLTHFIFFLTPHNLQPNEKKKMKRKKSTYLFDFFFSFLAKEEKNYGTSIVVFLLLLLEGEETNNLFNSFYFLNCIIIGLNTNCILFLLKLFITIFYFKKCREEKRRRRKNRVNINYKLFFSFLLFYFSPFISKCVVSGSE